MLRHGQAEANARVRGVPVVDHRSELLFTPQTPSRCSRADSSRQLPREPFRQRNAGTDALRGGQLGTRARAPSFILRAHAGSHGLGGTRR